MSDEIDCAQEYNELYQRIALDEARAKSHEPAPEGFDGKHCPHCGELIGLIRRVLGLYACYDCASFIERYKRLP